MDLHAGLDLVTRPQLVPTQRMQQALRVLQAPLPELIGICRAALAKNPCLEEGESGEGPEPPGGGASEELAAVASPAGEWEDRRAIEALPDRGNQGWRQLVGQVRLVAGGARQAMIAEYILGCLDDRGYLAVPVGVIARLLGEGSAGIEEARQVVLHLDPPGLAARDLRECLRVQLEEQGEGTSLAARMLDGDLGLLAWRRWDRLAHTWGVRRDQVRAAHERIRRLWPHPRAQLAGPCAPVVLPDLWVHCAGGIWAVGIHERGLPRLTLAPAVGGWLGRGDAATRAFVHEHLAAARWLLGSLRARRRTLVRLMRLLLEEQRNYFEHGLRGLRPLGYRDVGSLLGLHESTVARAVRGKRVQTPWGIQPLRFFFPSSLQTVDGEPATPAAVQARMRAWIVQEPPARPLTDEEIARRLRHDGVRIARRTVAKYRDRLGLPRAALRRRD